MTNGHQNARVGERGRNRYRPAQKPLHRPCHSPLSVWTNDIMLSFTRGRPHCKRCGYDLDGEKEVCPRCQFSPRAKGLRLSLSLLLVVVVSMMVTTVLPAFSPLLIRLAAVAFLFCVVVFFISFLATPYRLGSLFRRF